MAAKRQSKKKTSKTKAAKAAPEEGGAVATAEAEEETTEEEDDSDDVDDDLDSDDFEDDDEEEMGELAEELADQNEKIDDPVRMYLTQMGEIPLLSREKELTLAKQIEVYRKRFRYLLVSNHEMLQRGVQVPNVPLFTQALRGGVAGVQQGHQLPGCPTLRQGICARGSRSPCDG